MKYDHAVTEPRKELNFPLARAEAIALAELYLEFHLHREIFYCIGQTYDTKSAYEELWAVNRLNALIALGLVSLEEMDHMAELVLARDGSDPREREWRWRPNRETGLPGVRARLAREGVPGLELKCLHAVYTAAWFRGDIKVGTFPTDELAYQVVKGLLLERSRKHREEEQQDAAASA